MAKIQQLTFNKGVTNIPSDAICDDSTLEKSLNIVYDNGEHRPLQFPKEMGEVNGVPLAIHKTRAQDNYIILRLVSNYSHPYYDVAYCTYSDGSFTEPVSIMAYEPNGTRPEVDVAIIGNTIILNTKEYYVNNGLRYYLWKPNVGYKLLGDKIPMPDISFYTYRKYVSNRVVSHADGEGIITTDGNNILKIKGEAKRQSYNDMVVGLYEKNKKKIGKDNNFCEPFFVRYAIELFDGSYTNISSPVLLFPCVTENTVSYGTPGILDVNMYTYYQSIAYEGNYNLSEWSDIIKGVSVFVSDGVSLYDTSGDQPLAKGSATIDKIDRGKYEEETIEFDQIVSTYIMLNLRRWSDVVEDLKDTSVFYKISDIGYGYGRIESHPVPMKDHTIDNLTSQPQLKDDYYSRCGLSAGDMLVYNQRLIMSGVKRGFFDGDTHFISWNNTASYSYTSVVYIDTPEGQRIVTNEFYSKEKMGWWFFYPDPRAKKAELYIEKDGVSYLYKTMELTEHPFLNGAYYISTDTPSASTDTDPNLTTTGTPPTPISTPENLNNQIWVSEVNNPFVFNAEGNVTIGSGSIITISSITQALSQGQFGQYPLIVFSTDGIWACSTGSDGLFASVHPMSREVCNTKESVTQTDGNIFFSSEKGLMLIDGSKVACVSEQLNGKSDMPFAKFLKTAKIAYDYRDSMLWIINNSGKGYIYAIKSGTFSDVQFNSSLDGFYIINAYPDTLIAKKSETTATGEISKYTMLSLLNRDNINDDTNRYSGEMVSRPMKLENSLALKVINEVKHISMMDGTITLSIYASNDLRQWYKVTSTHGKPWKYYKFYYGFSSMKATDRFAGTLVETEERHTNKLR